MTFEPKIENWFYCKLCRTLAYRFTECCSNISCSGGGCEVCCQGSDGYGNNCPSAVVRDMIKNKTCPSKDEVPHKQDGLIELLDQMERDKKKE